MHHYLSRRSSAMHGSTTATQVEHKFSLKTLHHLRNGSQVIREEGNHQSEPSLVVTSAPVLAEGGGGAVEEKNNGGKKRGRHQLNVFVLKRARGPIGQRAGGPLEEGKLEFRDPRSGSVSSRGQAGGQRGEGGGRKPGKTAGVRESSGERPAPKEYLLPSSLHHLPADSLPELVNTS